MRPFNIVPWLICILFIVLVLMLKTSTPTWAWVEIFFAAVSQYGKVADVLIWRMYKKEREEEVALQTAVIEERLGEIEKRFSSAARKRAEYLRLTGGQLTEICETARLLKESGRVRQ